MSGRVAGKVAIIVGGGQTPGETIGNGRATALLLAQEGARVFVADRDLESAEDTADLIRKAGGEATACLVDVVEEEQVEAMVGACIATYGAIDILHNNVGASLALGDALATELSVEAFDRIIAVNLRGMWLASKHALPQMRKQEGGSIINISSMAARSAYPYLGYKTTKVAVVGLTENLAAYHADAGVRVNAILPGLMNTPMAIEPRVAAGADRAELTAQRDSQVLLGRKMGTGWDIARASLFLHSDEASFITGISLAVDGGSGLRR
ncbi:MAG: SDR family oxidoreductase [Dehalococcoidia bacterium]|jgi:NAD(P)-dependent dehydrogenase (short-subunit alcohol dehydrogenase family)|nr:SDR family oxidoreductase [Dehalococcoidia bacterium]